MRVRDRMSELWRGWVRPLLVTAFVLGSFRSAVADWNDVPSGSMRPTILEGDRIFVDRRAYEVRVPFTTVSLARHRDPARGDIVVFLSPVNEQLLVKRVVGVPGDELRLDDGRKVHVPAERYFVMGDNRDNSFDSRSWGFVERRRILGRARAVVFSLDRDHSWRPRWPRFFTPLR